MSNEPSAARQPTLDLYRGLAILLMCLADFYSHVERVPAWLKHGVSGTITVVDLVAPMFVVALAAGYGPSYRRRLARDGRSATWRHFCRRGLAIIGVGLLFTFRGIYWGLFQTLGLAVLLALPLMELTWWKRLLAGLLAIGGYQALLSTAWRAMEIRSTWCEPRSTLAWAAMLVVATALTDLANDKARGHWQALGGAVCALLLGTVVTRWVPPDRHTVSLSFWLIALGATGLAYAACRALAERLGWRPALLLAWGRNPLLMYIAHYWLWIAFLFWQGGGEGWPLWALVVAGAAYLGILGALALWLDRRGWWLSV